MGKAVRTDRFINIPKKTQESVLRARESSRGSYDTNGASINAIQPHLCHTNPGALTSSEGRFLSPFRYKIPVAIVGATGVVGQKFVELLSLHPWFEIVALAASQNSAHKCYGDVVKWSMPAPLLPQIAHMQVLPCTEDFPCKVVFSGLDSSVAKEIELDLVKRGHWVISNASCHRMHSDVPLLIPEVNPEHLQLLRGSSGIVANPNCSVIGITMALKPLLDIWGIEAVHAVTLQALSGAGYPGVPSLEILDNVIPYIAHEEEKVEQEPLKILGELRKGLRERQIANYPMRLSAQCTRVPVSDGHLACLSVKLRKKANACEIISAWREFSGEPQRLHLPHAPKHPLVYFDEERYPQPKLHRLLHEGMSVSIGRLRPCSLFDWKFVILSHNTIRGAAGCAVLNAELMRERGYFDGEKRGEEFFTTETTELTEVGKGE